MHDPWWTYIRNNILKLNQLLLSDYAETEESESIIGDILQLRFTYIFAWDSYQFSLLRWLVEKGIVLNLEVKEF